MSPHFFALFLRKARRFQREDFEMRLFLSSSRDVRKRPATERPRVKDPYEPVRASFTRNTYHHYSRSLRVPMLCFRERRVFLSDDLFSFGASKSSFFFLFFFRALKNFRRELLAPKCQKRTKKKEKKANNNTSSKNARLKTRSKMAGTRPPRLESFFFCVCRLFPRGLVLSRLVAFVRTTVDEEKRSTTLIND